MQDQEHCCVLCPVEVMPLGLQCLTVNYPLACFNASHGCHSHPQLPYLDLGPGISKHLCSLCLHHLMARLPLLPELTPQPSGAPFQSELQPSLTVQFQLHAAFQKVGRPSGLCFSLSAVTLGESCCSQLQIFELQSSV